MYTTSTLQVSEMEAFVDLKKSQVVTCLGRFRVLVDETSTAHEIITPRLRTDRTWLLDCTEKHQGSHREKIMSQGPRGPAPGPLRVPESQAATYKGVVFVHSAAWEVRASAAWKLAKLGFSWKKTARAEPGPLASTLL